MNNTYFVAGTDTGVGKTMITAGLMTLAKEQGYSTYGLKPIAAGCDESEQGLVNDDALILQAAANVPLDYAVINPVAVKAALSPHIAAAMENKRLSIAKLEGFVRGALMTKADWRFVEGAGGWRVPVAPGEFVSDIPKRLKLPVILVVGMRLGCLNHARLTAEAIANDGLPLAGWVANCVDPAMSALEENINTLSYILHAPCLGKVPWQESVSPAKVAEFLDLPAAPHARLPG